jgi:CHAT domain-containing protein/Tfp pilus assembly protein PilF
MRTLAGLCVAVAAFASPATAQTTDLLSKARSQPDTIRMEITRALAEIATGSEARRKTILARAYMLADSYSLTWSDPFLRLQVQRFAGLTRPAQRSWVVSDSLRRAGNDAMAVDGVPAAMKLWRESLRRATALGERTVLAPALVSVGAGHYRAGALDSATWYLKRASGLADATGDWRTLGNAIGVRASVARDQGDFQSAIASYRMALRIRARSGDTRGMAADENNLAAIAQQQGNMKEARAAYERAASINRREKRHSLLALNLANLGGLSRNSGEYARSESLYVEALALHRSAGGIAEMAFTHHELGRLYMSRGDYRRASRALEEAIRGHTASGAAVDATSARLDLAAVASASGNPESARAILAEAARGASAINAPPELQASVALSRAELAVRFGTFDEAQQEYSRGTAIYRSIHDSLGIARGLEGSAFLLYLRGDYERALKLLDDAGRLQLAGRDRRSAALTRMLAADVWAARGDTSKSRRLLGDVRETFRALGDAVGEAASLAALGDLSLSRGSRDAGALYRAGLARLGSREAADVRWRLHAGLGDALRKGGALTLAAEQFRLAIDVSEKAAATLKVEERRSGFLSDKWSAYTGLALVEQARGRAPQAFEASERMRARQLHDLLARGRVARTTRESIREQDLRHRVAILTERLQFRRVSGTSVREPALATESLDATRAELDAAQKAYANLLVGLRDSDPAYSTLVSPRSRSWKEVARRLKSDEVFLEYLLTDSASTVFVVSRDTVVAIDLRTSRARIADLVEFCRRTMEKDAGVAGNVLWRAPLRRLYLTLIEPVAAAGFLRGKRSIMIAPHGELHFLSFAALIAPGSRETHLVERFRIAYTPSATIWLQLGDRQFGARRPGVLGMAPNVRRLPGSQREADALRRIYGRNALVRTSTAATTRALRDALPDVGIVHLATFGVLNKHNPLFSFVELAPSRQDDGRLEVNEVFGLGLSGQLVILSACQTALASGALADVPPGDDWVGLVQAFLSAGARSVVASLWPVEDRATGELMEQFHRRLVTGVSPAIAIADAQRALISNPSTARPRFWAAFVVNGH